MGTIEEAMEEAVALSNEELITPVNDILMINPETREIDVPVSEMLFGVRTDKNVEIKYFKCPKIVGNNIDLSQHKIYVVYQKSDEKGTNVFGEPAMYWCEDMTTDETGDYITFSWILSGNVLDTDGFIAFKILASYVDSETGSLKTRWNTIPSVGVVKFTLSDGSEVIEQYTDVITQLLQRMEEVEQIATPEAMQEYVNTWFVENKVVDSTLSLEGKAADAKVTGDKISELKSDLALNVLNDEQTKRSLDYLWKLNKGISYQFETDANKAYQKIVPSGVKLASMKQIGGKTIVWNQLLNHNLNGENLKYGVSVSAGMDGILLNGTATETNWSYNFINYGAITSYKSLLSNHKYLIKGLNMSTDKAYVVFSYGSNTIRNKGIFTYAGETINGLITYVTNETIYENYKISVQLFDLTIMFGAGNEPATVEEFESMFPEDYYPYDAGTLMSAPVNEVVITDMSGTISNTVQLPQAILDLYGYGDSVSDDVYNYVDFENKKYHKRVGKVDLGTLGWNISGDLYYSNISNAKTADDGTHLCDIYSYYRYIGNVDNLPINSFTIRNGTVYIMSGETPSAMLYYELAEEEIIDISDILTDDVLVNLEVEAGGTLTFHNSNGDGYRIPVPNEEEYLIALAEVNG